MPRSKSPRNVYLITFGYDKIYLICNPNRNTAAIALVLHLTLITLIRINCRLTEISSMLEF
jgi:hypothetical protein